MIFFFVRIYLVFPSQQALTKTTPTARSKFCDQLRSFLDDNRSFDECLAVRMATETRQWDLLTHLSR